MRGILGLLALALAATVGAAAPAGPIDQLIAAEMPASGAPGLAYAIVEDGTIRAGARGELVAGSGRRVTPDTPYLLGSISKSFTALAVMQLVEAGKVELDAPVERYLPVFAGRPGGAITVRQLLSHTSGWSTVQGNDTHGDRARSQGALSRQVEWVARQAPAYPAGERWEYSNTNYQVLGGLVEAVSGRSYAAYVEAEILAPTGMTHSFVADGKVHDEVARGHRPWFGTRRALAETRTERANAPAGGVIASATDVARYLAMMMNGADDVLSAEGKAEMLRPASAMSPFYGLGWFLDPDQGTAGHSGLTPGNETLATVRPAARKGVVVLVNASSGVGFGETAGLLNAITAHALGLDYAGEGSRWPQKALFVGLALLPLGFGLSMLWAWRFRAALRAKTGSLAGRFSLWFPLASTLAMAAALLWVIPPLFGGSMATLRLFQPDLALAMTASAVTGVAWALFRLAVAYAGKSDDPPPVPA